MKSFEIVGHSFDGGIFCLECSVYDEELYDKPEDSEGNPVHIIFAGDECAESECASCGCNLLTGELPEKPEDADADDSCTDDHTDRPAIRFSHDDSEDY